MVENAGTGYGYRIRLLCYVHTRPDEFQTVLKFVRFHPVHTGIRTSKAGFPLGAILRAERTFSLSCDFSGGTN
jgi:hypothetical protein